MLLQQNNGNGPSEQQKIVDSNRKNYKMETIQKRLKENVNCNKFVSKNPFTKSEIGQLHDKAVEHFYNEEEGNKARRMVPINVINRNGPKEYFDGIRQEALKNGGVELMSSYMKNGSGHPESSINGRLMGLFFSTFVFYDGSRSTCSPFGEICLSVDAQYLIQPDNCRLFFADFYCARFSNSTREGHTIILVLCMRGTEEELFCLENLWEIDIASNPFLKIYQNQCYVGVNLRNEKINLFFAHCHFNISKAKAEHRCRFSKMETIGRGFAMPDGQIYDYRCKICAIRENGLPYRYVDVENKSEKDVDGDKWQIWKFDCPDLPEICPWCKMATHKLMDDGFDESTNRCPMCKHIAEIISNTPNCHSNRSERWADYFSCCGHFAHQSLFLRAIHGNGQKVQNLWPSQFCEDVRLDRKLGVGFFRKNCPPDWDNPLCHKSGLIRLNFKSINASNSLLYKFDALWANFIHFACTSLPMENVAGFFVRIDYQRHTGLFVDYFDGAYKVPCMLKMELWIRDRQQRDTLNFIFGQTKEWIQKEMDFLRIPSAHLRSKRYWK